MLSDFQERVVQLREEAVVTPKKVTFVDKEMSRDECIIGLEGFEDEKDADMNRSIRCAAVTLNQPKARCFQ